MADGSVSTGCLDPVLFLYLERDQVDRKGREWILSSFMFANDNVFDLFELSLVDILVGKSCSPCPSHVLHLEQSSKFLFEPPHDKISKMTCTPSEDSDQPGHQPSLIRAFAVRMKQFFILSLSLSAQRRL